VVNLITNDLKTDRTYAKNLLKQVLSDQISKTLK